MKLSVVAMAATALLTSTPMVSASGTVGGGSSSGADATRASEQTKQAHKRVDVITASRAEIERRITALDRDYANQEAALASARAAVSAAQAEVEEANLHVADAQQKADAAREVVRDYVVGAYIRPPSVTSMSVLSISDTQDAGFANNVLKIMANERHKVVDTMVVKKRIAAMEEARARKAMEQAQKLADQAQSELDSLARVRQEQVQLVVQMNDRLGDALAEAASLEAIDEQAARELAASEMELHNSEPVTRLVAATATTPPVLRNASVKTPTPAQPPRNGSSSTTRPASPTTRPANPTTTRAPSPTTTTKPPAQPSGIVTWAEIVYVGGIPVHRSVASNVAGLLNAATAAGLSLSGGGYRDSASQIATRRANCGSTYYDIYEKPSGQCTPPTAIPGRSMHERGLAMDLKSNGALITSRSNPAFIWLSANAARFGFYNLPSEPWHWSTNGH